MNADKQAALRDAPLRAVNFKIPNGAEVAMGLVVYFTLEGAGTKVAGTDLVHAPVEVHTSLTIPSPTAFPPETLLAFAGCMRNVVEQVIAKLERQVN